MEKAFCADEAARLVSLVPGRGETPRLRRMHGFMLVLFVCLFAGQSFAASILGGIRGDDKQGIRMEVRGLYDTLPPYGFVPMRVEIENKSGRTRTWRFQFDRSAYYRGADSVYRWSVTVEDGKHRIFDVMVPICTSFEPAYHTQLNVTVSGYGLKSRHGYYSSSSAYSHKSKTDPLAMSAALAAENKGLLEVEVDARGNALYGAQFEPGELPADWRALLGFQSLWLSVDDWRGLDAAVRDAVVLWVEQGGHLFVAGGDPALGVHAMKRGQDELVGLGTVSRLELTEGKLDIHEAANRLIRHSGHDRVSHLKSAYTARWPLLKHREVKLHAALLVFFLFGFATLVGPVNLIWFAGKYERWRLFVTTPLIALGASLLMATMILFQDGIGGEGERVAFKLLVPEKRQVLVVQEQASRSGVMLSRDFAFSDRHFLGSMPDDPSGSGSDRKVTRSATHCGGDWFNSRSGQSHYLMTFEPTRARLEQVGRGAGGAPVILSSFDQTLQEVYLLDHLGRCWFAENIVQGRETKMRKGAKKEFTGDWWTRHVEKSGLRVGRSLETLRFRSGYFCAVAKAEDDDFLATHPSIRWRNGKQILAGPYQRMEASK